MRQRIRAMRLWLVAPLLVLLMASPVSAQLPIGPGNGLPPMETILLPDLVKPPIPVSFGVVPNHFKDMDPAYTLDLNGDGKGDIQVGASTITAKNGAKVRLIEPVAVSLDFVQILPGMGYNDTAPAQLSRVYAVQTTGGAYAKFLLTQVSPKVEIWFCAGKATSSVLNGDGTKGHAVLTWDALPDATLGYSVYRYEMMDSTSYTATLLNDFVTEETTFTDDTARNRYYLYVVTAVKADGTKGSSTTVEPLSISLVKRSLAISLPTKKATLDGKPVILAADPVIQKGRLMVPASVLTHVGVKIEFNSSTGRITLTRKGSIDTYTVVMTLNETSYLWNGASGEADVPPYLSGSVVMIPLRSVVPYLGFGLTFDSIQKQALVEWLE